MTSHPRDHEVVSKDGTSIGYIRMGAGRPIVIVHGAWVEAEAWRAVAEHLAEQFTCHVVDRRGRARSRDGTDYSFDREVEDIEAVLEAAGPDARLLGHSSGAIYSLEAARRTPPDRLVLYEPPLRPNARWDSTLEKFRDLVEDDDPEAATTLFYREEVELGEDELSALQSSPVWPRMTERASLCLREWDALRDAGLEIERYRDVSVPTLLLGGTQTADHPSFAHRQLHELMPNTRLEWLEGQGHVAHKTAPEELARTVAAFLS